MQQQQYARVHLGAPFGAQVGGPAVKNDEIEATDLADRLRMHRLPEAWVAPPEVRELRELLQECRSALLDSALETDYLSISRALCDEGAGHFGPPARDPAGARSETLAMRRVSSGAARLP